MLSRTPDRGEVPKGNDDRPVCAWPCESDDGDDAVDACEQRDFELLNVRAFIALIATHDDRR